MSVYKQKIQFTPGISMSIYMTKAHIKLFSFLQLVHVSTTLTIYAFYVAENERT